MKLALLPICVLAGTLLAQQPSTEIPADAVVAVLNGRKYTADEIRRLVAGTPPQAQAVFARDPKAFLRDHASLLMLVSYAEQNSLEKTSPYRETLEFYRLYVLSNAAINHKRTSIEVSPEEQKAWFVAHEADFREARVRMIYLPFSDLKSEGEAKTKADGIVKRARAGEDFVKLAKQNSEDSTAAGGDFTVRPTSSQPPAQMKTILLSAKGGTITDPLRHDNGYYVFRVENVEVLPYDKVRDDIYKEIQNVRFREWQQKTQAQSSVKVENEAF
ncbi:MAG: peptidylprolyl isomerase, partial [Bryobacteraceae bacterium]|nr:peptidylprolyl isomerase [Bryobacteraceae bacterium]